MKRALDKYDFNFGSKFTFFAAFWIEEYIRKGIYYNYRLIRLPSYLYIKYNKMQSIYQKLTIKLGREPLNEEVAQQMQISKEEAMKLKDDFDFVGSLDKKVNEDFEEDGYNIASDDSIFVLDIENKIIAENIISCLSDREKYIIKKRFFDCLTFDEIGKEIGVTRQCIYGIYKKAMIKTKSKANSCYEDITKKRTR